MALSAWVGINVYLKKKKKKNLFVQGDRMWNFAVGIYFISLNPTNLQGVAINGIVINLAVILFGTAIGVWIDRNPRLSGKE
jgi:hypothetical protein